MNRTPAVYSVVQYLPDPGRGEAANVGVVLYVPAERRLDVRTTPTLARVKKFFDLSGDDLKRVELAVAGFGHRLGLLREELTGIGDLTRFAAARADAVRLTAPLMVAYPEPLATLDVLYRELVGEYAPDAKPAARSLPPRLAAVFARLEAAHKVWRPGAIKVPTAGTKFKVDAAYKNGVVNFVRGESLAGGGAKDRLPRLGFSGQLIRTHKVDGEDARLVVVSSDAAARPDTEARFHAALAEFGVEFISFTGADAYAAKVEQEAH